ncbi:TetR/AcrR family transcriptional regulator [Actinomadura harenae]|uniref:TetR/AcrR family transcriptional regulator n=1 Tax=Actinomadura harenae TaxID=2483351 RepID=UPI0013152B0E|nr:TetR/AcrR family transcriptional regulator [Actinomadura harenae]
MTKQEALVADEPSGPGTRTRLLDAAVELIAESGWAATTSRSVAERAGVNNALVHYYFGSVDALRRAAVTHALESELEGPVLAILQADDTLDGVLHAVGSLTREDAATPGPRVLAEALVQGLRDPVLREQTATQLRAFRELLAARLAEDRAAGRLRGEADPAALAVVLTALLDGLLLHRLADPGFDAMSPTASVLGLLRPPGAPHSAAPAGDAAQSFGKENT